MGLCGAFAVVAEPLALKHFNRAGHEFFGTAFELAARYFRGIVRPAEPGEVISATRTGLDLSYQWLSLLAGQQQVYGARDQVLDLNRHPSPIVAEYSLWAAHRDPGARLADLTLYPQDIGSINPNVRRWYYRMVTKLPGDMGSNLDIVEFAIADVSEDAREGLAIGLRDLSISDASATVVSAIAPLVAEWFNREESEHIRRSLHSHLELFGFAAESYRDVLASMPADRDLADTSRQQRIYIPQQIELPNFSRMLDMTFPTIYATQQHNTYILAIDTVDFSIHPDDDQIKIFRDLLNVLADRVELRKVTVGQFVTLLTGDGLILAFRDADNRHLPLELALAVQDSYSRLAAYKLRFGVHDGTAYWIDLADHGQQLIGHAVNWSVRVMSQAEPRRILVSNHYYDGVVKPDVNRYRQLNFKSIPDRQTKHGESIEIYKVES